MPCIALSEGWQKVNWKYVTVWLVLSVWMALEEGVEIVELAWDVCSLRYFDVQCRHVLKGLL